MKWVTPVGSKNGGKAANADALSAVGLSVILPKCIDQKIDLNIIKEMSDRDMIQIGVETIGDRIGGSRISG